ncbi:MAG: tRNA guanosine(34) transglycosylase Tgt [Pelagibacteraceae bacterium]|nr:tRNA guanosine(34) transglycosylase Tgt [Pelagibacteraceae bacterium]|tara:strand:- start:23660 stop:24862 length:1203 start_codon:yes stop_codon:yes gene_type:complete
MTQFSWTVNTLAKNSNARTGEILTPHGKIKTPAFIFCATKGALKSFSTLEAKKNNTQIILSNTYHLMLQPGSELIASHGGLHKFMNWDSPILTDSGGFQIFSLGYGSVADEIKGRGKSLKKNKSLLNITEEGSLFKSYVDGSFKLLTPEKSIEVQRNLGADLILVFDECTPFHVNKSYTNNSMKRSHRWAIRSLNHYNSKTNFKSGYGSAGQQKLYGIIQGGIYEDLREESINFNLNHLDTFGLAIGGSLGSSKEEMYKVVNFTAKKLGNNYPVHLLGIGDPNDIWKLVKTGIDTFDCVSPTRLARHGSALTRSKKGKINLKNIKHANSLHPIDNKCECSTCKNYSLSYLHYLFKSNELLGFQLITCHNIYFMNNLMYIIRKAIVNNNLEEAEKNWFVGI